MDTNTTTPVAPATAGAADILQALNPDVLENDVDDLVRLLSIMSSLTGVAFDDARRMPIDGDRGFSITFHVESELDDIEFLIWRAAATAKRIEKNWTDLHNHYCDFSNARYLAELRRNAGEKKGSAAA